MAGRTPSLGNVVAILAIITLVVVNFGVIIVYNITQSYIKEIRSITSDTDALKENAMKWVTGTHIEELKTILGFATSQIERVMIVDPQGKASSLLLDVSSHGEWGFLSQHIARTNRKLDKFIVDIGAYDGLLGSNSFNFFQMGWDGLLVEPHPVSFKKAAANVKRFQEKGQSIGLARVAVSDYDGEGQLYIFGDNEGMENSLQQVSMEKLNPLEGQEVGVQVVSATTLCREFNVPKRFGILSIDAEGVGDKIMRAFISAGFRPDYIIYEWLGMPADSVKPMQQAGYQMIATIGFNQIWELPLEKA